MNERRRKNLRAALNHLEVASNLVIDVSCEEQLAHDNLPDVFQYGDQGEKMETAIADLEEAGGLIEDAIQLVNSVL